MNAAPVITVITAVYNAVGPIEKTIESVTSGYSVPIEYIVIDGGSTDGTVDVLEQYQDRISYWVSEPDTGIYHAMNKGWAAASDDSLILFLGAGDRLISLPVNPEAYLTDTILYGSVQVGEQSFFISSSDWRLKYYNSLHHQGLLIPKRLHPDPPFNCRYRKYADFDFNQRLYSRGMRFGFLHDFRTYAMPGGVTGTFSLLESLEITKNNFGVVHAGISLAAYIAMNLFSPLRCLRPYSSSIRS